MSMGLPFISYGGNIYDNKYDIYRLNNGNFTKEKAMHIQYNFKGKFKLYKLYRHFVDKELL